MYNTDKKGTNHRKGGAYIRLKNTNSNYVVNPCTSMSSDMGFLMGN
jgi:hypothetical protein